jgi:hypothetical protein
MENECKKCGCDDAIPVAPCLDPTGCPEPQKCEETFDTDCVLYNGSNIECGGDVIISSGDSVSTALQAIADIACTLGKPLPVATVVGNEDNTVTCTPSGGVGPYTYQWTIEQGPFNCHTIVSGATSNILVLDPIPNKSFVAGSLGGDQVAVVWMTHLKVVVTDSEGSKVTKYYTYAKYVSNY